MRGASMTNTVGNTIHHFSEINPQIPSTELVKSLIPPPHFSHASFDNYRPDPDYPSQEATVNYLRNFLRPKPAERFRLFRKKQVQTPAPPVTEGVYLDGGFGVGKTHLLAAL